jgi:hypothetical protein
MTKYTTRVAAALRLFESEGPVHMVARSVSGIDSPARLVAAPPFADTLPGNVLKVLADREMNLRVRPVIETVAGRFRWPLLFVMWRPPVRRAGRQWELEDGARERILASLATMPKPSVLIDGGFELWAGWRLDDAIDGLQQGRAALGQLGDALGAGAFGDDITLPLAGAIRGRDWNDAEIDISEVDLDTGYTVTEILAGAGARV